MEVDGGREISMRARNGAKCETEHMKLAGDLMEGLPRPGSILPHLKSLPLTKPCPKLAPKSVLCGMLMLV